MKNKLTQFSKFLLAGAAIVLFSFSIKAQDANTESHAEASTTEPNALLSASEIKERTYAAEPVTDNTPALKADKKAAKVNPIKVAIAIHKINKMIKKAELKDTVKSEKVKDGTQGGGLSQNMKVGILLAAIGLLVAILGGLVSWILFVLGVIVLIIGLIIIIVELVNNM